jgi:hypothetical protein
VTERANEVNHFTTCADQVHVAHRKRTRRVKRNRRARELDASSVQALGKGMANVVDLLDGHPIEDG